MINHLSIPQYLLESSFCLIVFYLFYHFLLRKETHFQLNRAYLINSALLSLGIPIINIDFDKASQVSGADQIFPVLNRLDEIQIGFQQTITQESNTLHLSVADVVTYIYLAGFFVMTLKLAKGLFRLFAIIRRSPKMKDTDHTLLISDDIPAASFFSYIFWQDKTDKNDLVQKTILDHEMVHVRQWHSLDVIAMELMVIVKWFNPLIYLFRNSLKQTHEFIADKYVTERMIDKVSYTQILLNNKASVDLPPATNHFYGNIGKRIKMLDTKQSSWLSQTRYLMAIPIVLVLFSLFSFDLSDRFPQGIKAPFQKAEQSMLAKADQNIVSLDLDETEENQKIHLNWNDILKASLSQTGETHELIFNYSKKNLAKLLDGKPIASQNGDQLILNIDRLAVLKNNQKLTIDLDTLTTTESRQMFVDSLSHGDQITVSIQAYSQTDSLQINLYLGLDGSSQSNNIWIWQDNSDRSQLMWGSKKFDFHHRVVESRMNRINYEHTVTSDELESILSSEIQHKINTTEFAKLSSALEIRITLTQSDQSRLSSIDFDELKKPLSQEQQDLGIVLRSEVINGNEFSILQQTKFLDIDDFYAKSGSISRWLSQCQDSDKIEVDIYDPNSTKIEYTLIMRYRDEQAAATAPFPLARPISHLSDGKIKWNYQVVMNTNGHSFVRVDADDPANQNILEAYGDSDSYQILNIESFKSGRRVYESNIPQGVLSVMDIEDHSMLTQNIYALNDHYFEEDDLIRMDWGKMVSLPGIGNYSLNEFKRSSKRTLALYANKTGYKMARYDVVVIPKNGKIKRLRTDRVDTQAMRKALSDVTEGTSIYIDNIILDHYGKPKFYPYNFVFTID